jgi:SHS2 domain-containing protein
MKTIDYFSHTADLRMKLAADTVPELFEAALSGMNEILRTGGCAGDNSLTIEKKIQLKSRNITTLLVEFMNEVLALSYTFNAIFCTLRITLLTNRELVCFVTGREVSGFDDDIKAVTYHEADVRTNAEGKLETIIVFDI